LRHGEMARPTSSTGKKQTLAHVRVMSALQADIAETRARSTVDIA